MPPQVRVPAPKDPSRPAARRSAVVSTPTIPVGKRVRRPAVAGEDSSSAAGEESVAEDAKPASAAPVPAGSDIDVTSVEPRTTPPRRARPKVRPAAERPVVDRPPADATAVEPVVAPKEAKPAQPAAGRYPRLQGRKRFRARRVRRLVRHVDPWSVFKLALLLNLCMAIIFEVAGLTLWSVARSAGTIDNIESTVKKAFGLPSFTINPNSVFSLYSLTVLIWALALTGAAVVGSILFNLISDLIGGVWISVIEEETAET